MSLRGYTNPKQTKGHFEWQALIANLFDVLIVSAMARTTLEKLGTSGAFLAALACPICFPKLALVGAALGLGVFAPYEGYLALAVQALFVVAFAGQWLAFRRHRNRWLLALSAIATLLLFVGFYVVRSAILLQIALAGLAVASVWLVVELRRCAKCAAASPTAFDG